ncbi:MAG: hypothetical protein U1F59_01510 [Candidatus Competibacteraceae bacterium]
MDTSAPQRRTLLAKNFKIIRDQEAENLDRPLQVDLQNPRLDKPMTPPRFHLPKSGSRGRPLLLLLTLLTCLLSYWLAFSAAADEPTPEISEADLQRAKAALPMFSAWLDDSGLGESLNIIRLRRARHPDPKVLPKVLWLELRWIRPADTREEALAGFDAFDTAVAKRYGGRIGEHLLFKLINITGTPARLALVNISIKGTDIATYLDTNGRLVTVDTEVRMVSARGELPKIVTVPTPTLSRIATAPMPSQLDTGQILELLDTHFSSRGGYFRRLEENSGHYVRFLVERLKGQVISDAKYWENLQGELYAVSPDEVRLILDGKYAAGGIGESPPSQEGFSDMEPRFVQPLQRFTDELMMYIKSTLKENHP